MTLLFVIALDSCTENAGEEQSASASTSTSVAYDDHGNGEYAGTNRLPVHYVDEDSPYVFDEDDEYEDDDYYIGHRRPSSINQSRNYHFNSNGCTISGYDDEGNYYHFSYDGDGNMHGYDMNGNFYHSHTDGNGNTSGYDSNGNFYHSHTDGSGNTTGYDSNGNFYHSHTDGYGNTTIYDSNGNMHQIRRY